MKLEIKVFEALCELKEFKINDIKATYDDFGKLDDLNPKNAEPYGCGNMTFIPYPPKQEVLDKYNINLNEYYIICKKLDCLSFGSCSWCV